MAQLCLLGLGLLWLVFSWLVVSARCVCCFVLFFGEVAFSSSWLDLCLSLLGWGLVAALGLVGFLLLG